MPGGDRTGPAGYGPMTGRGFGYCAGSPTPGFTRGWGRGFGWGRGRGRGWGRGWGAWGGDYPYPYPSAYPSSSASPYAGGARAFPTSAEVRTDLQAYRDELKQELAGVEETLAKQGKKSG